MAIRSLYDMQQAMKSTDRNLGVSDGVRFLPAVYTAQNVIDTDCSLTRDERHVLFTRVIAQVSQLRTKVNMRGWQRRPSVYMLAMNTVSTLEEV